MNERIILVREDAPAKPAWGEACNGCGVCCLAEPCPLGILVSGRLRGSCRALRWDAPQHRYRCGLMRGPGWIRRWVARRIAAGRGCDSSAEVRAGH
jgi:hypothetical protein